MRINLCAPAAVGPHDRVARWALRLDYADWLVELYGNIAEQS
jgi:hypothetical protein